MTASSRGQASIEVVGGSLALLLVGLIGLQLLAAGYAAVMADHAAEAAALALAGGGEPRRAARAAVPGWPKRAMRVRVGRGLVAVTLAAPSPLAFLRGRLAFRGEAAVRGPRSRERSR